MQLLTKSRTLSKDIQASQSIWIKIGQNLNILKAKSTKVTVLTIFEINKSRHEKH